MSIRPWLAGFRARLKRDHHRRVARGRQNGSQSVVQNLEQRTLLTATGLLIGTELTILTDADESVVVQSDTTTGNVQVLVNGTDLDSTPTVSASALTSLTIVTGDGDNQIDLPP